ncbi:hypothetical protein Nepgr_004014 [Nepenthes gracilis]|uniref:Uncharacterized protein n=1 Tax=Nepenthes gracilis TaxID=150966 RepID=A0AAD3XEP2_NEPGR|nr:hypothetical protein Nepgr_004014 [Nepenthes gracilis]
MGNKAGLSNLALPSAVKGERADCKSSPQGLADQVIAPPRLDQVRSMKQAPSFKPLKSILKKSKDWLSSRCWNQIAVGGAEFAILMLANADVLQGRLLWLRPKCIAFRKKLLGGWNMLQEPSALTKCDVAGDVASTSLKKHRSRFCDSGLLAFPQVV